MVVDNFSYNMKIQIIQDFFWKGLVGDGFYGDVYLIVKLLLLGVIKIVYNLNDKQIVKFFSCIFNCNLDDMVRDLEQVRGTGGRVGYILGGVFVKLGICSFFFFL